MLLGSVKPVLMVTDPPYGVDYALWVWSLLGFESGHRLFGRSNTSHSAAAIITGSTSRAGMGYVKASLPTGVGIALSPRYGKSPI